MQSATNTAATDAISTTGNGNGSFIIDRSLLASITTNVAAFPPPLPPPTTTTVPVPATTKSNNNEDNNAMIGTAEAVAPDSDAANNAIATILKTLRDTRAELDLAISIQLQAENRYATAQRAYDHCVNLLAGYQRRRQHHQQVEEENDVNKNNNTSSNGSKTLQEIRCANIWRE
jgi:hypothetical protein